MRYNRSDMAITDKLRKAASLFVVMPEGEAQSSAGDDRDSSPGYNFSQTPSTTATPAGGNTPGAASPGEDDLDRRLAAMNAAIKGINAGTDAAEEVAAGGVGTTPALPTGAAGAGVKTIDEMLRESEGPSLNEISVSSQDAPGALADDGTLDFGALYQAASLPASPFSAEQMLEMLAGLPANMPLDMKRQTVQVTLGAMGKSIGATPETIVADASRKLAALAAYDADFSKRTEESAAAAESEIAALLAQVEEKRKAILDARQQQSLVRRQCEAEADRLDDVLEFFSLDVGASKYAGAATPAGTPAPTAAGPFPPPLPPGA
jgi:hypothetical protein